ncbi:TetR/AcrR family transcriptional regulator [Streptomyces sp. 7N604]|uniref:TetR/AcrR family transcriptional regulator n=1 Tax=Streptomyces sp. 7N604 TaxID=3457415 RepID=UPI003FD05D4C
MGAKRMPRAVREQQMLDAAVETFAQRGYRAASMDEIAELAGVSKPLVYLYLNSKEELFNACIRREVNALVKAVRDAVRPGAGSGAGVDGEPGAGSGAGVDAESGATGSGAGVDGERDAWSSAGSAAEQLWNGLRGFFAHTAQHPHGWAVVHSQARTHGEPFAAEVAAMRAEIVEFVTRLIAAAAREAECTAHFGGTSSGPPDELAEREVSALAHALVGAAESLAGWANDRTDDRPSAKETAGTLMNFAWAGLENLMNGRRWSTRS